MQSWFIIQSHLEKLSKWLELLWHDKNFFVILFGAGPRKFRNSKKLHLVIHLSKQYPSFISVRTGRNSKSLRDFVNLTNHFPMPRNAVIQIMDTPVSLAIQLDLPIR